MIEITQPTQTNKIPALMGYKLNQSNDVNQDHEDFFSELYIDKIPIAKMRMISLKFKYHLIIC